jgi:hypothetical protein
MQYLVANAVKVLLGRSLFLDMFLNQLLGKVIEAAEDVTIVTHLLSNMLLPADNVSCPT